MFGDGNGDGDGDVWLHPHPPLQRLLSEIACDRRQLCLCSLDRRQHNGGRRRLVRDRRTVHVHEDLQVG